MASLLDAASDKLTQVLGSRGFTWKLKPDLISSHDLVVLFTPNNDRIEVVDLKSKSCYSMKLPFEIESLLTASADKWLILTTSGEKFVLRKSHGAKSCPDVVAEVNDAENFSDSELKSVSSCARKDLSSSMLSDALGRKIDSPNRLIAGDGAYAGIIVGFPDLESGNEVFVFPRNERVKSGVSPIVTDDGQVIRSISPGKVPADGLREGKRHPGASGYLEVVDVVRRSARYIPIPQ